MTDKEKIDIVWQQKIDVAKSLESNIANQIKLLNETENIGALLSVKDNKLIIDIAVSMDELKSKAGIEDKT